MLRVFLRNPVTQFCLVVILLTVFAGVFAPLLAPHDPYENNILMKFASPSWEYPLGTDQLGRCVFSRMLYGIRPTFFLSLLTMAGTIGLGLLMGVLAGYFRGPIDEFIMRVVDVMLSFPSQIMILAVVALMGVNIENVIIANIFIKWAWYARMIRTAVVKYTESNFISRHGLGHSEHLHALLPRSRRPGADAGMGRDAQRSQERHDLQSRADARSGHCRRRARRRLQPLGRQPSRRP